VIRVGQTGEWEGEKVLLFYVLKSVFSFAEVVHILAPIAADHYLFNLQYTIDFDAIRGRENRGS